MNALEVKELTKVYPEFTLDKVSFCVPQGHISGLIGRNGAGKSTTIKGILRLIAAEGDVAVFGRDIIKDEMEVKQIIGYVGGGFRYYPMNTLAAIRKACAPFYPTWNQGKYEKFLAQFGLSERKKVKELSEGMKVKFALALALSHEAKLLIMDEPTSGLDPLVRSQFLGIVMDYMENGGKGVFFSTHITSDLDKIADMLVLIDGGKIVFQQSKDDLLDTFRVVKGNAALLNDQNKKLIRSLKVSSFGFTGITDQAAEVKKEMPDVLLEKASIEDIMLAYIGGDNDDR